MPNSDTYPLYQAYVVNVNDFLNAETEIRRTINDALRRGKPLTVKVQTKVYALLYSTFSEANFMKMVLTPYGFDQNYVEQILKQENIQQKWYKCLELAFSKFSLYSKGSEVPNKLLELKRIVMDFVVDPSIIRNKVAHGQLTVALNSKNTSLNVDLTQRLSLVDFVTIYRWFEINKRLTQIIEDLIESPDKAHYKHYYSKYQMLEEFISKTQSWNTNSKLQTPGMKKPVNYFPK